MSDPKPHLRDLLLVAWNMADSEDFILAIESPLWDAGDKAWRVCFDVLGDAVWPTPLPISPRAARPIRQTLGLVRENGPDLYVVLADAIAQARAIFDADGDPDHIKQHKPAKRITQARLDEALQTVNDMIDTCKMTTTDELDHVLDVLHDVELTVE